MEAQEKIGGRIGIGEEGVQGDERRVRPKMGLGTGTGKERRVLRGWRDPDQRTGDGIGRGQVFVVNCLPKRPNHTCDLKCSIPPTTDTCESLFQALQG